MGSGTNRAWWREKGSRSGRRSSTKSLKAAARPSRLRMKAHRAEAKRRASDGKP